MTQNNTNNASGSLTFSPPGRPISVIFHKVAQEAESSFGGIRSRFESDVVDIKVTFGFFLPGVRFAFS